MNYLYLDCLSIARNPALRSLLIMCVVFAPLVGADDIDPSISKVQVEYFNRVQKEDQDEALLHDTELHQSISLQFYELDRIQFVESALSKDLHANPEQSRRLALRRIQGLDSKTQMRMKQAATGLVRAASYGIDRYPAIVFDGQAVVYGITDLPTAFKYYQAWRTGNTL